MSAGPAWGARVAAGLVWLALFSILYTAGDAFGLWPELPPGALKDLDLAVGASGLALLGLWLLRRRSSP